MAHVSELLSEIFSVSRGLGKVKQTWSIFDVDVLIFVGKKQVLITCRELIVSNWRFDCLEISCRFSVETVVSEIVPESGVSNIDLMIFELFRHIESKSASLAIFTAFGVDEIRRICTR